MSNGEDKIIWLDGHPLPDLAGYLDDMFKSHIRTYTARSVHASAIGHPCARSLVYDQVRDRKPHDVGLQCVFEIGTLIGEQANIDVAKALRGTRFELVKQEENIPINKQNIGGRIDQNICFPKTVDGKVQRFEVPVEVKSCAPYTYDSIDTYEDMKNHRSFFIRKYIAQLTIYMHFKEVPAGLFLLRNKNTGRYKVIPIPYEPELAQELLARAQMVTDHVALYKDAVCKSEDAEKTLPDRIKYDPKICDGCSHKDQCIPDLSKIPEIDMRLWDAELEAYCRIMEENEAAVKEYKHAADKIKEHCEALVRSCEEGDTRTTITDTFAVTAKVGSMTRYDVPKEEKIKYKSKSRVVRRTIKRLNELDIE